MNATHTTLEARTMRNLINRIRDFFEIRRQERALARLSAGRVCLSKPQPLTFGM
jgi:uncharacterized protein YjiS (DUF1127 family)